ncbi:MAG: aminotransferase class I/II-fold pyridoxal phosphate-dependent enzyme, partial [Gammaproteobacteria bacterium]|nr:aminotransferase class I/II-fold pyridoxal phosphate-dependent enzyme [Gammaproteobacteria bacterium]
MERIAPFYVMELLNKAHELEAAGRDIIHMEVGEPDFVTPEPIIAAAQQSLTDGRTHYTPATGIPELREAIAAFYLKRYGFAVDHDGIIVTPGASGALQLVMNVAINPGEEVLIADPGYPCNRHFVQLVGGESVAIPVGPESNYQLEAASVAAAWTE